MDKELLEVSRFDSADYLKNDADMKDYLDEVSSENSPQALLQAVNTIVRAKGREKLSKDTGIPGESLY